MKPSEILVATPQWHDAKSADILSSPAWAMPCRLGDTQDVMRLAAMRPADVLPLAVRFEDEPHVLGLTPSPRFPELERVWSSISEIPEPIILALVEKECGAFLQMLENAVRRQLKIDGISKDSSGTGEHVLALSVADVTFTLSRTPTVVNAFGVFRNLDLTHPSIRETPLEAECEYAAFALPQADVDSLAPGDALLLPEIGTVKPRLVVAGCLAMDESGVSAYVEDEMLRIRATAPFSVTLGSLFDGNAAAPEAASPLKMVSGGRTLAFGRLDTLAGQRAFVVEKMQ